jgi:predicted kinase
LNQTYQTPFFIFSGLPGTGKSTLANRLARELRWPLLRSVIADSDFMGSDRIHAQEIASARNANFRPVHCFVSNEKLWEKRVVKRRDTARNSNLPLQVESSLVEGQFHEETGRRRTNAF